MLQPVTASKVLDDRSEDNREQDTKHEHSLLRREREDVTRLACRIAK